MQYNVYYDLCICCMRFYSLMLMVWLFKWKWLKHPFNFADHCMGLHKCDQIQCIKSDISWYPGAQSWNVRTKLGADKAVACELCWCWYEHKKCSILIQCWYPVPTGHELQTGVRLEATIEVFAHNWWVSCNGVMSWG
jgi:hypothetical protein